jgi:hypothetical protein
MTLPAGCYVAGHWGHYGTAQAVAVMLDAGWSPPDGETLGAIASAYLLGMMGDGRASGGVEYGPDRADALARETYGDDALGILIEASEEAALWADAHVPPHHWVGWLDGEYGCWPVGDGEDQ